jgi:hypothetical protein
MEFTSFEDYWPPFTTAEGGSSEQYIAGLSEPHRAWLTRNVRRAYLADYREGPPLLRVGDLGLPRHSALALSVG